MTELDRSVLLHMFVCRKQNDESGKHEAEKRYQLHQRDGRRIFASNTAGREVGGWWEKAKT